MTHCRPARGVVPYCSSASDKCILQIAASVSAKYKPDSQSKMHVSSQTHTPRRPQTRPCTHTSLRCNLPTGSQAHLVRRRGPEISSPPHEKPPSNISFDLSSTQVSHYRIGCPTPAAMRRISTSSPRQRGCRSSSAYLSHPMENPSLSRGCFAEPPHFHLSPSFHRRFNPSRLWLPAAL